MEILPVITGIIKWLIILFGLYGCVIVITSTVEYNQNKTKNPKKAEEVRGHLNRGFGIAVGALLLYLVFTAIGPIFTFLF